MLQLQCKLTEQTGSIFSIAGQLAGQSDPSDMSPLKGMLVWTQFDTGPCHPAIMVCSVSCDLRGKRP